jgi:transcriptional regulator with XRE-family HTH domain
LYFIGPAENKDKAVEILKKLKFMEVHHALPWREAFPELTPESEPGQMLRGARYREWVTQLQLSAWTGIPRRHISEMEHGKRSISRETAKKLAKALKVDTRGIFISHWKKSRADLSRLQKPRGGPPCLAIGAGTHGFRILVYFSRGTLTSLRCWM